MIVCTTPMVGKILLRGEKLIFACNIYFLIIPIITPKRGESLNFLIFSCKIFPHYLRLFEKRSTCGNSICYSGLLFCTHVKHVRKVTQVPVGILKLGMSNKKFKNSPAANLTLFHSSGYSWTSTSMGRLGKVVHELLDGATELVCKWPRIFFYRCQNGVGGGN